MKRWTIYVVAPRCCGVIARRIAIFWIVMSSVGFATVAHASAGLLLTRGAAPVSDRETGKLAVRAVLQQAGWHLSAQGFTDREIELVVTCLKQDKPWDCITRVVKDKAIDQLMVLSLDREAAADGSQITVATARVVVASQNLAFGGRQFCERCTTDKLAQVSAAVATEVLRRVYVNSGRTVLDIRSIPPGARVVVNGTVIGATDLAFEIVPGRHAVVLSLPGYRDSIRSVDTIDGKTSELVVSLEAAPVAVPVAPARVATAPIAVSVARNGEDTAAEQPVLPSWLAPAGVGAGAVAVAAGSWLLYAGRDQPKGEPQNQYNVSTGGIFVVSAGLIVAGAGCYFWRWPWTRARKASKSSPTPDSATATIIPLRGGLAATFSSRF